MLGLRTKAAAAAAFGHPEVRAGKTVLENQWEFGSRQSCVSAGRKRSYPSPCARLACSTCLPVTFGYFPGFFFPNFQLPSLLQKVPCEVLRRWKQLQLTVGRAVCEKLMALVPLQCLLCRVLCADCVRCQ